MPLSWGGQDRFFPGNEMLKSFETCIKYFSSMTFLVSWLLPVSVPAFGLGLQLDLCSSSG